jgi:PAS domain S-box-containing protein
LRDAAEARLAQSPASELSVRSDKELLHELQVHQIELEMENKFLREVQQAEALHLDALDRFRKLTELVPGVVYQFRLRPDGSVCMPYVSDAFHNMFHLTADEVREDATKALMRAHPDDVQNFMASIQTSAQSMTPWQHEYRLKFDDGTVRWVFGNSQPQREADGSVLWHGFITDITERKQTEVALVDAEERWRFAIEGAGDGLWDWNVQTGVAFYSPRYKEMLGFAGDEIGTTADEWTRRIHPDDAPSVFASLQPYMDGKPGSATVEFRMLCKDGSWQWTLGRGMVVSRDPEGKALRMIGTNTDISARKQAEEALRENEQHFRTLANGGSTLIWTASLDKLCNYFNEPWLRFTGRSLEQEIGNCWAEGVHPDDFDRCLETYVTSFDQGKPFSMDYRLRHAEGDFRWIRDDGNPRYDSKGDFLGYIGFCYDINEHKKAAAELEKYGSHLEELVSTRTAELEQSRDAAEAGNRAKTIFLANMSHELRTPMNGVMGMIDLVLRRATDPKLVDWLNKSKGAAQRMINVVNDILDYSKIEAERLPLEERNFSLSQMIDDTIAMQDIIAEAKGLNLARNIPATFPDQWLGDAFRLRQILLNLLGNACKFSDQGTITVRVSAVEQYGDSVLTRIEVEDQGIGINPEQQAMLFQSFTQADGSMTRKHGGTGLGLVISKRLANLMGGDAGMVSQEGHGSTFWVTVRLKPAKASAAGV